MRLPLFRDELLPALGTFDPIKVYAPNPVRRDLAAALRAESVEGRLNYSAINFLPRHAAIVSPFPAH